MELYQINPYIRYAKKHIDLVNNQHFSKCYECRLFYILNGSGSIEVRNKSYNFSNNYVIYLPPATEYRLVFENLENNCVQVLNFDMTDKYFKDGIRLGTPSVNDFDYKKMPQYELPEEFRSMIVKEDFSGLSRLLAECIEEYLEKRPFYKIVSSASLKHALIDLLREQTLTMKYAELTKDVLNYIHQNYENPTLKNEDIAKKMNYHPYHLNRILKETTGKSLRQYLLYYRMRVAKDLLLTTNYDITTISWKVGFNSVSHFVKTFQAHSGITPQRYRQYRNV